MRIDYTRSDWPEQQKRANEERAKLKRLRQQGVIPWKKPKSRAYAWTGARLSLVHNAQDGRCANPGCRQKIPLLGPTRAVDPLTDKMLCKACSITLGLTKRQPRVIVGLLAYLGFISEESLTGVKRKRRRRVVEVANTKKVAPIKFST